MFTTQQGNWILALLIVVMLGCRKDRDTTAPSVRIISPTSGLTVMLPDTLLVQVSVSDDTMVKGLVIEVVNEQGAPVAASVGVTINATSATIAREFIITDERLLSGSYTIVARASDGTNEGRAFLDITLLEVPLRLRSIYIAPPFSTNSSTIQKVDSAGQLSNFITVQDLNGFAVDGYSQHVIIAGSQFAPLQAIPTSSSSAYWQFLAPTNDAPEQFAALAVDANDRRTYFATRDGMIRGFEGEGAQRYNAQSLTGYRTEAIVSLDGRIATWQKAIASPDQRTVTYTVAGTVLEVLPVDLERVGLFRRTTDRLVLFANESGAGVIRDLNITEGGIPLRFTFSGGTLRNVVQVDGSVYFVALPDRIIRYTYSTNGLQQVITGMTADAMAYDRATGTLFVAQGSDLHSIDPNSGTITRTIATGNSIGHIAVLNNR